MAGMLKKLMITAPVDKVWATLTCDEHMKRWFSGADVQRLTDILAGRATGAGDEI